MKHNPLQQLETTIQDLRSPKRAHTFWGFLVVLAAAYILMLPKHHTWIQHPNDYVIGLSPDGFKNYMTLAWHVERDTEYVHYRGMNYPYGEHVMFTDMQPLIATVMFWWNKNVSDISDDVVGILNVLQLLSMLFGAGILFLLFRKLHLPVWYGALAALGLLFLSPQYNRFDCHFGLSHTWVFPMLLLLLCRYEERHSRRYQSLQIGIFVWLVAQLHFYYFGMSALFLGLYTMYQIFMGPSMRNIRARLSHLVIMVLLPFVFLNIWMHWANYSADRPGAPAGFLSFIAYPEGVFLPYDYFPEFKWIEAHIGAIRRLDGEAMEYAGLVALLFTLYLVFSGFRMFGKTWKEAAYHRVHSRYLKGILVASSVLLFFSFGFPFGLKGMDWMLNYMGPLKQFRGLGRFTWPFYYCINVVAFYTIWNFSVRFKGMFGGKAPWLRWVIVLAPLLTVVYEAYTFHHRKKIDLFPNLAQRSIAAPTPDHWLNKVDFSRFQALMPIPYCHIGSENIWMDLEFWLYKDVFSTALHTGVPDLGVNMSRTPVDQMSKSVQLALIPCEVPAIFDAFPDNRPIALLVEPTKLAEVRIDYKHLLDKATLVYDHPDLRIMSLELDSLRAYQRELARSMRDEMNRVATADRGKGWKGNTPDLFFYTQTYDSLTSAAYRFQGKGAFAGEFGDTTYLWKNRMPKGKYVISFWSKIDVDRGTMHEMEFVENAAFDGHVIATHYTGVRYGITTIVNGWALFQLEFDVTDDQSLMRIYLRPETLKGSFWIDQLMIRRDGLNLYRREPGWVVRNNYWHRLEEE